MSWDYRDFPLYEPKTHLWINGYTLCGNKRVRDTKLTETFSEVTCKFCKKKIDKMPQRHFTEDLFTL